MELMKKLFILPLLAVIMTMVSCSNDDDNTTPPPALGENSYAGMLRVGDFEKSTVVDIVTDDESSTLTVVINDAQFAPNMPFTIDIKVEDIPYIVYGENKINFEATDVDPYIFAEQAPGYRFATIQGTIDNEGNMTLYARMADGLAPYLAGMVFNFNGERVSN